MVSCANKVKVQLPQLTETLANIALSCHGGSCYTLFEKGMTLFGSYKASKNTEKNVAHPLASHQITVSSDASLLISLRALRTTPMIFGL